MEIQTDNVKTENQLGDNCTPWLLGLSKYRIRKSMTKPTNDLCPSLISVFGLHFMGS